MSDAIPSEPNPDIAGQLEQRAAAKVGDLVIIRYVDPKDGKLTITPGVEVDKVTDTTIETLEGVFKWSRVDGKLLESTDPKHTIPDPQHPRLFVSLEPSALLPSEPVVPVIDILITAGVGVGKSTIMMHIAEWLKQRGFEDVLVTDRDVGLNRDCVEKARTVYGDRTDAMNKILETKPLIRISTAQASRTAR